MKRIYCLVFMSIIWATFANAVTTTSSSSLNVSQIKNGTQSVGEKYKNTTQGSVFVTALPTIGGSLGDFVKSPSFVCSGNYKKVGLACLFEQTRSPLQKCTLPSLPAQGANCNVSEDLDNCRYSVVCQGGSNGYSYGSIQNSCPNNFKLINNRCVQKSFQSTTAVCGSGWRLSGSSVCIKL